MTSLTCGAAVITFNGMKHLPQQLDSIVAQTRAVQHIVISDDNSTDGTWEYLENGPDEFRVKITKLAPVAAPAAAARAPQPVAPTAASAAGSSVNLLQIDARGLEPPEPLIRILDALESLPTGFQLRAITDREPCHLFGEAEQRGFRHACTERPDHSWVTVLERA